MSLLAPVKELEPRPAEHSGGYLYNAPNVGDGLTMLRRLRGGTVPLVVFDPQYRGVLDALGYGNEGARQGGRADLPQMSDDVILRWLREIERVLRPSRYLLMWQDKHAVCEGTYRHSGLPIVDMITWVKPRIGMGYRTRRKCEYLLVLQKPPIRAADTWSDHGIPDVWEESASGHPHAKPFDLLKRLIGAITQRGEFVIDPCAGSYVVMNAAHAVGRQFLGADIRNFDASI